MLAQLSESDVGVSEQDDRLKNYVEEPRSQREVIS